MLKFFKTRSGMVALGFVAIAGYLLVAEHMAHTIYWLPWLILLACPLMMFMHGGHGGHNEHRERPDIAPESDADTENSKGHPQPAANAHKKRRPT